jgi:hypothetical protein
MYKLAARSKNNEFSLASKSFIAKAQQFMEKTEQQSLEGVNPGGHYQAVWCRDASYILRSWFHSGNIHGLLQQVAHIWSHQIEPGKEKIIYGRGSPEMRYKVTIAKAHKQKDFEGSLPTTIYADGFSEVFGQNPDIDSTALMISTTSWILTSILRKKEGKQDNGSSFILQRPITSSYTRGSDIRDANNNRITNQESDSSSISYLSSNHSDAINFVVPRMLKAIDYLVTRDIDNDGVLEQNHNEDWMDNCLRAGKIVYSQACWILALNNLSYLLSELNNKDEAERIIKIAHGAIDGVDQNLWSENDQSYIDIQQSHHIGGPYRTLTQDVSLYLVAITENTEYDSSGIHQYNGQDRLDQNNSSDKQEHQRNDSVDTTQSKLWPKNIDSTINQRANSTLDAIKQRLWKEKWPLDVEVPLKSTGSWFIKPYKYQNYTCWPWITGIELLARSRFNRFTECYILLSKLTPEDNPHTLIFYEWINTKTGEGGGAYPFRTGICSVRNAVNHILKKLKEDENTGVRSNNNNNKTKNSNAKH